MLNVRIKRTVITVFDSTKCNKNRRYHILEPKKSLSSEQIFLNRLNLIWVFNTFYKNISFYLFNNLPFKIVFFNINNDVCSPTLTILCKSIPF